MKFLFYLGHPAHYHLFKNMMAKIREEGHVVQILIKKKDVLEPLLIEDGVNYRNILPKGRGDTKASIAWGLAVRDWKVLTTARKFRPDLMLGTSAEIAHVGKLLKIPSAVLNEDDFDAVPLFSKLAYPYATHIVAPESCRVGRWSAKAISYAGYHELAYLHPNVFAPDRRLIEGLANKAGRYFILRFAKLTAHHDAGKTGIRAGIAKQLVEILEPRGSVYISAERELEPEFGKCRIPIRPSDMHHALYFADMFIGDSQTMTAEAAVLGTPALRFNDFVGKLGYLEELEYKYGLTYGIKTNEPQRLFDKIEELLKMPNLKEEWQRRRRKMLSEKIDLTKFMVWFMENYPQSAKILRKNSDYQWQFK